MNLSLDKPFHGEWKHRSIPVVQFMICVISIPIALYAVELIRLVIDGDDGDRLWGIGVSLFAVVTLSYLVIWGIAELVQRGYGMVFKISRCDFVSTIDSIRQTLDENGMRYKQVEDRYRLFILSTPRYTLHLDTGGIDIVVTLIEFWKGAVVDLGPVTDVNREEAKRIIDLVDI